MRLSRPRVLTQGDEGSAYVSVQDRTGLPSPVTLGFKAAGAGAAQAIPLKFGSGTVRFPLRARTSGPGLTPGARAVRGSERDALRETLPLRGASPRTLLTSQGTQPQRGVLTDVLTWPSGGRPESLTADLAVTSLQAVLGGLDAHMQDPEERWVTTEGVAARLGANLDLTALAARLGWRRRATVPRCKPAGTSRACWRCTERAVGAGRQEVNPQPR
ncbi:hypothetical protein [Deinococcus hopiensis]|uniref:hypothetical protein n=1 Tax=Deinococcus hopiensis TaxID=309885 RepID=UPI00111C22AD|nr:hypothetical protein [Deinococcus hopiensis]